MQLSALVRKARSCPTASGHARTHLEHLMLILMLNLFHRFCLEGGTPVAGPAPKLCRVSKQSMPVNCHQKVVWKSNKAGFVESATVH